MNLLLAFALAAPSVTVTPNRSEIGLYDVYELTLTHQRQYENPWEDVAVAADFRSPGGRTYHAGGFYYDTNSWKLRFAPAETGHYTWSLTFTTPAGEYREDGGFKAAASASSGFLRRHKTNPYRLITEKTGAAFYPIGIQQGYGQSAGLQFFLPKKVGATFPASAEDYFSTYTAAGFNLYRSNGESAVDIASFNIDNSGENSFRIAQGLMRDALAQAVHKYGWKLLWAPMAAPNDYLKNFDLSNPMARAALLKIYQYNIDRFGAYVDIWELMNENGGAQMVPPAFYATVAAYIREHDPYGHPITTSYEPPVPQPLLELSAPHLYPDNATPELDQVLARETKAVKKKLPDQPVLWGEIGNRCPIPDNDPDNERYRILLWTSFFNEAAIVPWNSYDGRAIPCVRKGPGLSNLYLGELQRAHALVFSTYVKDFEVSARPVPVTVIPAADVRVYGLGSSSQIGGYIIRGNGSAPVTLNLEIPRNGMRGRWMDPASGMVISQFTLDAGRRTVAAPEFSRDIVFRIE